jgi:hypothetical protein
VYTLCSVVGTNLTNQNTNWNLTLQLSNLKPLNISGEARWNFLKIWLICMDKISHQMFRLQQALAPNDDFCSDYLSGLKKSKFV